MWLEYANLCADEVQIYNYMLKRGIYSNENVIADNIVDYYYKRDQFDKAKFIPENLCNIFKDENKIRFYEKLKSTIEAKISKYMNSTILFPEIINRYLQRVMLEYEEEKENFSINVDQLPKETVYLIKLKKCEDNLREVKNEVNELIKKFYRLKEFLLKYDESFKLKEDAKIKSEYDKSKKPHSFLMNNRFGPVLPMPVITNILSSLNITYYYNNAINSSQSSLVKLVLEKTKNLPSQCKLLHLTTDGIDKALFEYLFKIKTLVYLKYERECFLTKISFVKLTKNNPIRTFNINYSVQNIIYLYGIKDSYVGIFTPFYFILFDVNKFSNILSRFRFEIIQNHFTEDSPVAYLYDYNPRCIAFSVFNILYIIIIDPIGDIISLKNKFEGHRREITKISYKKYKSDSILISASKNQIIMWNLDNASVYKIFAIDDQLIVKEILLISINILCIITLHNQLYVLEFGNGNNIKNMKIINFNDEQTIYQVINDESFVYKLDCESLSLYNYQSEKNLLVFKNEIFANYDLIFVCNDYVLKKCNNKGKIAIFTLY